jgi:hypothetical protein
VLRPGATIDASSLTTSPTSRPASRIRSSSAAERQTITQRPSPSDDLRGVADRFESRLRAPRLTMPGGCAPLIERNVGRRGSSHSG